MREFRRIMLMLLIGLLTAIIIYPFLHEMGHSIATLALGGKVMRFQLLPLPNIICDARGVSDAGIVIIGLSGMLLPITISIMFMHPKKRFWAWYTNLILRGINALSIAITIGAVFLYAYGKPVKNEDITTVLNIVPDSIVTIAIVLLLTIYGLIIIIAKDKPLKKIGEYLLK